MVQIKICSLYNQTFKDISGKFYFAAAFITFFLLLRQLNMSCDVCSASATNTTGTTTDERLTSRNSHYGKY